MKNEIFVEMEETCEAPSWFDNVKPFMQIPFQYSLHYILEKLIFMN